MGERKTGKPRKHRDLDRARMETILETMPSAVVLVDAADGKFSYMNRRALELYGCTYVGCDLERHLSTVMALRPDGTPFSLRDLPVSRSLKSGISVRNEEIVIKRADGTRILVLVSSAPLFDSEGRVTAAVAIFENITERKRSDDMLRESELRQVFLSNLSDSLRLLSDPFDIQARACRLLGEFFKVDRVCYADIREDEGVAIVRPDYFGEGLTSLVGRYPLHDFFEIHSALRIRTPFQVADVGNDSRLSERTRSATLVLGLRAFISVPLVKDGKLVWTLSVLHSTPRDWTPEEVSVIEKVGGRTWDAIERARAVDALTESEGLLRAVTDNSTDAIYVKDRESRWLMANPAVLHIVARTAEQAIGKTDLDLYSDPLIGSAIIENDRRVLNLGMSAAFEELADTPEGRRVFLSIKAPRRDLQGNIVGLIGISRDITERKRAEAELQKSKEDLETRVRERTAELERTAAVLANEVAERRKAERAIMSERQRFLDVLETLPVMICLLTPDHHVSFANQAYRAAFGTAGGRKCYDSQFGREDPCPECQAFVPLNTGKPHHWEWTLSDGRTVEIHNFPFRDADGSPLILEMDLDITAHRLAEQELRKAHDDLGIRAEQLRALASELTLAEQRERRRMAKVLHDHLQQLLVAAKFRTAILGRIGDEAVGQGASELEQLLDNAIDASRSLTAELSPPILHEAGLGAGLEWLARWMDQKHGLRIELSIEEKLPSLAEDAVILLFESTRELLFNAVKHAHVRTAIVSLSSDAGDALRLTVSDLGPGFDPARLKKAGEAGGGFGLFSIRERLDMIGGRMEIESAPGEGSRFILTCPVTSTLTPAAPLVLPETPAPEGVRVRAAPLGSSSKIRVLIADDHKIMREGLTRLLGQESDIEIVSEAADGQQAVEMAARLLPDVILMDMSMPRLNGVEATRAIHNDYPDIRIIGLSMFEESETAGSLREAGAVDYITKSGPSADLIDAIRKCMAGRLGASTRATDEGGQ